jgi:2-oxoisovalerate dehydrogenase E1 component
MSTTDTRKSNIAYKRKGLSDKKLKELYLAMLKPRLIEEKMLSLLRQGKISKWFSGIGQEAISVGCTSVMKDDEWIFPMHRNLGVFTTRKVPLSRLFAQWQGKPDGFTQGRDRSFHFGTKEYNIWGMISHLGPQLSLAGGVALAHKLANEKNASIAFTGEGGTSEGDFHEALNVAAVWQLPVIFAIENNGYGLSTPTNEQYACKDLADRGRGYGIESHIIDGNNILEVYTTLSKLIKKIRKNPAPILIEFKTFRRRGHEEASGVKYVPKALMEEWEKLDPIENYETFLIQENIITEGDVKTIKKEIKNEISEELETSYALPELSPSQQIEENSIYATKVESFKGLISNKSTERRFIDAITDGLHIAMEEWKETVLMGQDIADYGGVFKITDGFIEKYGKERVRNTPLCESAILGISLGLSMKGIKSMVEMQFADFVTCGFNQIVNNLAKIHYRWGHNADVVVRMPCGGGMGAGPFHSQTNEAWFTHTPGLKIVYPSNPADAKGLLVAAFADPNPVLFFEHKGMYRSQIGEVPEGYYEIEIGQAHRVKEGHSLSIITYGMGVHWATEYCEAEDIDADIIDLRSLQPLDYGMIVDSVKKTNRVIILHEDSMFGGIGGEISAYISENIFEYLDAPIIRVASLDTPVPFAPELEKIYLAKNRLAEAIDKLKNY